MARLLGRYRWELLLLVVIPAIAYIFSGVGVGFGPWVSTTLLLLLYFVPGIGHGFAAILLGVTYLRVRELGRPTLSLFWEYSLFAAVITTLSAITAALVAIAFLRLEIISSHLALFPLVRLVEDTPGALVLLWFARLASRISLAHAFLLVAATVSPTLNVNLNNLALHNAAILIGGLLQFSLSLLAVWAIPHFDGDNFQMRSRLLAALLTVGGLRLVFWAVIGIIAVMVQGSYELTIVDMTNAILVFALPTLLVLTYLVRVRPPPAPARETS